MPTTPESSQRSLDCATVIGPSAGTHACRVRLPSGSSSDDDRLDRSRLAGTAVFSACTSPLPPEVHVDPILLSQPLSSSSAIHASSRELYRGTPMFVGQEDADPAVGEAAGQTSSTGVSSPNSVGGHHLSLTHAECFMKQSCSEREEHFYEAVHPFQSFLIEKCLRSGRKVEVCGVDAETHSEAGGSEVGAGQDSQSDTEVDSETCLSPATTTTTPSNLHTPALPQFELAQSPTQPDSPPRHVLWDLQVPSSSCNLPVAGRWWRYRFKDYSRGDMTAYEIQRRYAVAGELQRRHALAVSFAQSHGEGEENHSDGAPSNLSVDARQGARTEKWEGSSEAKSCDTAVIVDEDAPHKREEERVRALRLLAPFIPRYYGIRPMRRDNLYAYMAGARRFASPITSPGTTTLQTPTTDTHQTPSITTPPLSLSSIDTSFSTGGSATVLGSRQETLPMKASASLEDEEPMPKCDYIKLLVLEDVCFGFKHPCVLDMKMGSRQYGLRPSAAKKRSKERKSLESTSGQHGIRLAGYKRWNETTQRFECKSKLACRNLSLDQLHEELCTFFMHSRRVMAHFARQLEQLRIAFSQQTVYRFYTSSLLFVYDADKPQGSGRLVMVDFAYTYEKEELQLDKDEDAEYRYDVRYIKALDTLLSLLT